jgi:hypothetical protein
MMPYRQMSRCQSQAWQAAAMNQGAVAPNAFLAKSRHSSLQTPYMNPLPTYLYGLVLGHVFWF